MRSRINWLMGLPMRYPWLTLTVLMIATAILSTIALSKQSLRLDEAQSLFQASRSSLGVFSIVAEDVHVPLYHQLLHFWQLFFGNGIASARILSMGFFLATIPAVYILGKKIFGQGIGLFAAALFAISPFMNWYGNEIRMYTLLTLMSVLSHYFFLRIYRGEGKRSWLGYVITAVLGIYSHYFFSFVLLSQGIFYLIKRADFPAGSFKRFAAAAAALAVAFAPWLIFVQSLGSASNTKPNLPVPDSTDVFSTLAQFLFGFPNDRLNALILSLWPISILLGFLALRARRRIPSEILYFLLVATVPILGAFLVSIIYNPVYLTRYLIISLPPLYLLLTWLIDGYGRKLRVGVQAGLVAAMMLMLVFQTVSPRVPVKEDYRAAAEWLNANASPQDVVVISAPFTVYPIEYYYTGSARLETLPIWDRTVSGAIPAFDSGKLPEQVTEIGKGHRYAYVVLSQDQGYQEEIRQYYERNFQRINRVQLSPGMTLQTYQMSYNLPALSFEPSQARTPE